MRQSIILYMTLMFGLISCVDEYNAELPTSELQQLVVEGNIVSGENCTFYLTTTVDINHIEQDCNVEDAHLEVRGSDGSVWQLNRQEGCQYQVNVGQLRDDTQYWLEITLKDGTKYSSTPATPSRAPQIRLSAYVDTESPNPRMEMRLEIPDSREAMHLRLNYLQWWEIKTPLYSPYVTELVWMDDHYETCFMNHGYGSGRNGQDVFVNTEDFQDCHVRNYPVYSLPVTSPRLSKLFYTKVICQRVSEEEYRYEEARRKQSDEMGGLFTPQPGNLPSNIRCTSNSKLRAMGFVGVRGQVSSHYQWVTPTQVGWHEIRKEEQFIVQMDSEDDVKLSRDNNYRLFHMDTLANEHIWVSRWLVDYAAPSWGGHTQVAPDFWPTVN